MDEIKRKLGSLPETKAYVERLADFQKQLTALGKRLLAEGCNYQEIHDNPEVEEIRKKSVETLDSIRAIGVEKNIDIPDLTRMEYVMSNFLLISSMS